MKTLKQLFYCFILSFFIILPVQPQESISVEDINKEYRGLNSANIKTEGYIIHYQPEVQTEKQKTTSYYLLKGYYGDTLRVNTAEAKPEINQKYSVWGILYMERIYENGKLRYAPFLSEKTKECLTCIDETKLDSDLDGVADIFDKCPGTFQGLDVDESGCEIRSFPQWAYYLGGMLILAGIFFAFVKIRNKNNHQSSAWETPTLVTDYSNIPKSETPPPYYPTQPDADFKTIKINTAPSKTMRLIPGRLEIINGEDKGKTFLIQGYPTKEGSIVSIGRETVSGERSHSHIQIDQRYQTVSRKQAEIISRDKKLFVRNLSETNITEVDGKELSLGEVVELNSGSVIKMGEIEFQYKV